MIAVYLSEDIGTDLAERQLNTAYGEKTVSPAELKTDEFDRWSTSDANARNTTLPIHTNDQPNCGRDTA